MIRKKWTQAIIFIISIILSCISTFSANNEIYIMTNGMTVILEPNRSSPMVSFCNVIEFGARNDPLDMQGAAHMIEHLVFNGTKTRTQEQLYNDVDIIGAYSNASTDRASTTYLILAPYEFAEKALEIQSDMLLNSTVPKEKFDKEKGIIIEEIGKQDTDIYSLAENYFDAKIFQAPGYSHPVLGNKTTVTGISRETIFDLYKKYYRPSNMILRVTGNFEPEPMKKAIEKFYGKDKNVSSGPYPVLKSIPFDNSLYVLKTKNAQINSYAFALPAPGAKSGELPAFLLLNDILNSRLNKYLKPNFPIPIMRIASEYIPFENTGCLKITLMTPPMGDPVVVSSALIHFINNYAFESIDNSILRMMITSYKVGEVIAAEKPHIFSFVNGPLLATGGGEILRIISNTIPWLTLEDITAVKERYFKPLKFAGIFTGPGETEEPIFSKILITAEMIKQASSFITSEKFMPSGEAPIVPPQTARSVSESKTAEIVLENGLQIGVIQSPDSPVFAVHILFKNRSFLEPRGKKGIASLLNRLLMSGTKQADSVLIGRIADAMGLTLTFNDNPMIPFDDIYTQPTFSFIRMETSNAYWKPSLSFLYNIMYHSIFPDDQFDKKKSEQLSAISKSYSSPSEKAKEEYLKKMFGEEHPFAAKILGTVETIGSITKDDLIGFRNLYFAPDNMIITVSSDQSSDDIIAEIKNLFGTENMSFILPEAKSFSSIEQRASGTYEVPSGKKQSYIYYGYLIPYEKDQIYAMQAANSMISDKLAFQLREKEGLAYSLGSSIEFYKNNALFTFTIGTSPENITKVIEGIRRELAALKDYQPNDEEILRVSRMFLGRLRMRTLSRINQAYYAGIGIFFHGDVDYLSSLNRGILNVNKEAISEAIEKITGAEEPLIIIAK
jgi:zinc protease